MLQLLTRVNIADNSGVIKGRIIKVLTPKNSKLAQIGSLVLISSKAIIKNSGILPGTKFSALVIRSKYRFNSFNYNITKDENSVVLVKLSPKQNEFLPIGTRIKGPICNKLFQLTGYQKVLALAKYVI